MITFGISRKIVLGVIEYVLPEYRHHGMAQGLFRELEKTCKSKWNQRSEVENGKDSMCL